MNRRLAAIEMQKIVAWVLAALVLLTLIYFITTQLAYTTEGSLTHQVMDLLGLT